MLPAKHLEWSLGVNKYGSGVRYGDCYIQHLEAVVLNWLYILKAVSYRVLQKL